MIWAILDSSKRVTSIVDQEEMPTNGVKAHPESNCAVGRFWNGWTFDAPHWSSYNFMLRFTPEERAAVRTAALTDETISDFLFLATAALEVIADDSNTVAGMEYLVTESVITEARKNEILS